MHSNLVEVFKDYSKACKTRHALFTTKDKPTSKRTLQQWVANFLKSLKIYNKSAHIFRHTAIMDLAKDKDTTLDDLQYLSRHRSVQSLASYLHEIEGQKSQQQIEKVLTDQTD